jgi:hypothetical protein
MSHMPIRKPCPNCGKPMVLLSGPKGEPCRLQCIYCDKIDPLTSPEMQDQGAAEAAADGGLAAHGHLGNSLSRM